MPAKEFTISRSFKTNDYSKFKTLYENRDVTNSRIKKIEESVDKVGWIPTRVVVNEKYEVIDGQARLAVAKKHGFIVYVDVVPGTGADECRSMNINQTNWSNMDFVKSYAEEGRQSYKYLLELLKEFGKDIGFVAIVNAAIGLYGGYATKLIRTGLLDITDTTYAHAREKLSFIKDIWQILRNAGGRTECYSGAIFFAYDSENIDNDILADHVKRFQTDLIPISTLPQAIEVIEKIYNFRLGAKKKVFLSHEYQVQKLESKQTS